MRGICRSHSDPRLCEGRATPYPGRKQRASGPAWGRAPGSLAPKLPWQTQLTWCPGVSDPGWAWRVCSRECWWPRGLWESENRREVTASPGTSVWNLEARGPRGPATLPRGWHPAVTGPWHVVLWVHSIVGGGQGRAQQDTGCRLRGLDPALTPGPGKGSARPAPSDVPPGDSLACYLTGRALSSLRRTFFPFHQSFAFYGLCSRQ